MPVHHTPERQPHIDGLRAIAVLAVIAFHAKVPQVSGGFAGVDVFFVISGYLITGILLRDMGADEFGGVAHGERGGFSFAEFYARRAKRLLPAALATVLATLLFGCLILTPRALDELARSAVAAVFFVANYWFADHSRYFDTATDLAPLTHLWSLAVEEQFYLVYPLFLFGVLKRWGKPGVQVFIPVAALASLALSVSMSNALPASSFYLLPTRAWELLLGGALCLWPQLRQLHPAAASVMGAIGMAMIAASLFVLNSYTIYPGYAALLPTTGSALVLLYGRNTPGLGTWLTHPLMRRIGDCSYSAYLWHWPLIVYYRIYIGGRDFGTMETVVLVIASLAAGYLSWRFIERPYRHRAAALRNVARVALGCSCVVAGVALVTAWTQGFPRRVDAEVAHLTDLEAMRTWTCPQTMPAFVQGELSFCIVGAPWAHASLRGVVWGDSHTDAWAPVLDRTARRAGVSLVIAGTGCAPHFDSEVVRAVMPGSPRFAAGCTERNRAVKAWLHRRADVRVVILAAAWSSRMRDLQPLQETGSELMDRSLRHDALRSHWTATALEVLVGAIAQPGRNILLLGDMPRPNRDLNGCVFAARTWLLRAPCGEEISGLDAAAVRQYQVPSERALRAAASASGATFISPIDRLCSTTHCPTFIAGEWLYMDDNHLRHDLGTRTRDALAQQLGLDAYFARVTGSAARPAEGADPLTRRSASPDS